MRLLTSVVDPRALMISYTLILVLLIISFIEGFFVIKGSVRAFKWEDSKGNAQLINIVWFLIELINFLYVLSFAYYLFSFYLEYLSIIYILFVIEIIISIVIVKRTYIKDFKQSLKFVLFAFFMRFLSYVFIIFIIGGIVWMFRSMVY